MQAKAIVSPAILRNDIHHGPLPGIVAIVFISLFIASLIVSNILTGGAPYPRPYEAAQIAQDYFTRFADAVRINAFLQFGSAIPLGIFTASVTSRLRFHKITVSGVDIALFGGFASSFMLMLSALSAWMLSQPGVTSDINVVRALQLFGFATGGVGHVVTFGLLLAGVSIPSGFSKLIPRWLVWLGLIVAALGVLSSLSIILPKLAILLPLGRYPGFIWLIGVGFSLPREKRN